MKNAFAIVTLCALMSACAVVAPQRQAPVAPAPAPPEEDGAAGEATSASTRADEVLPSLELSADLLYKLTKAELEFKGGRWQGPFVTLMSVAQQTRDPRIAHRAAEMALTAKQGGEALAAIRLWRELAPNSEEARQYFLGFVVLSEQMGEAEPIFSQRLRDAAPAARALNMFQMQQFLTRAKDKAAAFAMLERVLAPYLAMQESHLVLAQSAHAKGDRERAEREAREALRIKPDSELAALTLAQVAGNAQAADEVLTAFLKANPGAREVRAAYARLLIEQKQFEPARGQFQILLKDQPDNLATLYALGIISMQLGDGGAAEAHFKRFLAVLAAKPSDERDPAKVQMILAQLAEDRGDHAGALAWLDQVDGRDARPYFEARVRRAQLMARHGDLDGARKVLADIKTDEAEEQAQLFQTDAQLLRDGGYAQSAFTVLENALIRFPDNAELLYDFALLAEKLGKLEVMETSLRRVMARSPDNHHAYNALGYSLAERNVRLPEALALIDKALKMAPGDPFIMDSMGWVQFRLGNLEQAEELLRRAYSLRSDPEIAVHLGEVLWQKGDKADAEKLWREAGAKDPKNDALKSTLARLNFSL
ncbi:tetratricopeptide (TPR) repeat protein [Janthinobacterium sp. CG_S6]|nr:MULTISPECIES: tetratricopeptide repeat protein [unclassified Janthinobacterium]MEC5159106.1 tetratricopeptide (TPR) repeat protein [Janthinobacterium sp. CG_S6]